MPNFTFCRGREHRTTTFFFFSWTSIVFKEFNFRKSCQHLSNWTRWNKRDKVSSSANSLFKGSFHSCRCRCCLKSLLSLNERSFRPFIQINSAIWSTENEKFSFSVDQMAENLGHPWVYTFSAFLSFSILRFFSFIIMFFGGEVGELYLHLKASTFSGDDTYWLLY